MPTQMQPGAGAAQVAAAAAAPSQLQATRRGGSSKLPPVKPGVGMGQVRLLWGALAFVAVLLVAVAYRTNLPGCGSDQYRRRAGNADADRGHALNSRRAGGAADHPRGRRQRR